MGAPDADGGGPPELKCILGLFEITMRRPGFLGGFEYPSSHIHHAARAAVLPEHRDLVHGPCHVPDVA